VENPDEGWETLFKTRKVKVRGKYGLSKVAPTFMKKVLEGARGFMKKACYVHD
jgi:hypothetical protein